MHVHTGGTTNTRTSVGSFEEFSRVVNLANSLSQAPSSVRNAAIQLGTMVDSDPAMAGIRDRVIQLLQDIGNNPNPQGIRKENLMFVRYVFHNLGVILEMLLANWTVSSQTPRELDDGFGSRRRTHLTCSTGKKILICIKF